MQTNRQFTILNVNDYRYGRTYRIIRLSADKSGAQIAICEWLQEKVKTQHIFYASELA